MFVELVFFGLVENGGPEDGCCEWVRSEFVHIARTDTITGGKLIRQPMALDLCIAELVCCSAENIWRAIAVEYVH